jgi:heat-inducible transcriptional repressor
MLDNRKKEILQAIVEEYIETAEPVSSKAIVEKKGINYSSATIRNEMAELEKIGLLDKSHIRQQGVFLQHRGTDTM